MAVDVQEFRLQVTGQQQSTQRLNRFGGSMQSLEQRADAARGRISGAAGAIGNVGTIMSQTNPVVGAFAGVIGTAGSAIEALTSAVGGPLGIALGLATAALGLFVTQTALAEEEQEKLNGEIGKGVKSLDDYVAAIKERNEAERRSLRIRAGIADIEVMQARGDQLRAELSTLNRSISVLREASEDTSRSYDEIEGANRGLNIALQRREELEAQIASHSEKVADARQRETKELDLQNENRLAAMDREIAKQQEAERSARGGSGRGRTAEELRVESRRTTGLELAGIAGGPGEARAPSMQAIESRQGLSQLGTDILGGDEQEKAAKNRLQTATEAARAEQELAREVSATWQDASTTMATSMGSFFTALIQGNDQALGAILQNIGSQSIAQGTQAVLRAAVSAAFGNPAAGAQAAAGGALIAFGATLGGAGGAAGGGASAAARPTAPQQSQTFQSGSVGPGETTINFYGIADARTGEQVVSALRQTKRERGSQAVKV